MPGEIVPPPSLLLGSVSSAAEADPLLVLLVSRVLGGGGVGELGPGWGFVEDQVFLWGLDYWGRRNGGPSAGRSSHKTL